MEQRHKDTKGDKKRAQRGRKDEKRWKGKEQRGKTGVVKDIKRGE